MNLNNYKKESQTHNIRYLINLPDYIIKQIVYEIFPIYIEKSDITIKLINNAYQATVIPAPICKDKVGYIDDIIEVVFNDFEILKFDSKVYKENNEFFSKKYNKYLATKFACYEEDCINYYNSKKEIEQ